MDRIINRLSFTKAYLDDLVMYNLIWRNIITCGTGISAIEKNRINDQIEEMSVSYWTCD